MRLLVPESGPTTPPVPILATFNEEDFVLVVTFDQPLAVNTANAAAFTLTRNASGYSRVGIGTIPIGGAVVTVPNTSMLFNPARDGLSFTNAQHRLFGLTGLEVASFIDFPVTYI